MGIESIVGKDNGLGIPASSRSKVFQAFQRIHPAAARGEGVGLTLVHRMVARHGGAIWARGAVNQGATFQFTLTPGAHPPADAATGEDVAPSWQPTDREGSR